MKFKRILSMSLMLSILIIASACSFLSVSSSDKVETVIADYLNNKYPDLEFEIGIHTQDTYTSGSLCVCNISTGLKRWNCAAPTGFPIAGNNVLELI